MPLWKASAIYVPLRPEIKCMEAILSSGLRHVNSPVSAIDTIPATTLCRRTAYAAQWLSLH